MRPYITHEPVIISIQFRLRVHSDRKRYAKNGGGGRVVFPYSFISLLLQFPEILRRLQGCYKFCARAWFLTDKKKKKKRSQTFVHFGEKDFRISIYLHVRKKWIWIFRAFTWKQRSRETTMIRKIIVFVSLSQGEANSRKKLWSFIKRWIIDRIPTDR